MSDGLSPAGTRDDDGQRTHDNGPAEADVELVEATFGVHVRSAPPLAWLTALAAMIAMGINQILLPALNKPTNRERLLQLDRVGDYMNNLTAIAGLIAMGFGLFAFIRHSTVISMRQRLLLASFSGMFLPTIAVATLFERQRTTAQIVLFALGAAHVLGAIVNTSAMRHSVTRLARSASLLTTTMAVLIMGAQLLRLTTRVQLTTWQVQLRNAAEGAGELCYLTLLIVLVPLALPRGRDARERIARAAALVTLATFLGGYLVAQRTLASDFALLLYHAQRVTLFIDGMPRLYAVPLGLGCAAAVGSLLTRDPLRAQTGAAITLLIASGYAPHAPVRLLTLALAMVLIARIVVAPTERVGEAPAPPPPIR